MLAPELIPLLGDQVLLVPCQHGGEDDVLGELRVVCLEPCDLVGEVVLTVHGEESGGALAPPVLG